MIKEKIAKERKVIPDPIDADIKRELANIYFIIIIISRQENGRFLILGRAVLILPGIKRKKGRVSQAVTKDLSSSSKFSGSCVLTLQTLPKRKRKEGASVLTRVQDPLKENFCYNRSC